MNGPETARAGITGSALIDEAPAAIIATAPDGTLTAWNRRAEHLFGYAAEEAIGRTPEELGAGRAEAALGSRAHGGDVWEGEVPAVRKDGSRIRVRVVSAPVTDADGNPAGSISVALEAGTGDRAQPAQLRLELLLQASELLARSLDADAGLQGVARLAASWLADVCAFDLLDEESGMRRVAVADADRDRAPLTERLRAFPPDPDALHMTAALREGRTEILTELADDVLRDRLHGPRHIEVVRQIDARSAVILPLAARGRTLGAMLLLSCGDRPPFSADDVAVAEELARRTAVAVDNSVLLRAAQERADAAQRLQRLSDAALSHVDLDDLLEEILALLREELEADAAAVLLMEADAEHLGVRATSGAGTEDGAGLRISAGDASVAAPVAAGRPVVVHDPTDAEMGPLRLGRGVRTLMAAPLRVGPRTVGVVQTDWLAPRPLGQDEIDLIGLAAGRIALAVDRAQAYEAEHDARLRLELLARTSDVLGESLDFRAALGSLAHLIVPHVADWCAVDLVEPDRSHRTWVAHSDPAKVDLARELVRRYPADPEAAAGASGLRANERGRPVPGPRGLRGGRRRRGAPRDPARPRRALRDRRPAHRPRPHPRHAHARDRRVGPHLRARRRRVHDRAAPAGRRRPSTPPASTRTATRSRARSSAACCRPTCPTSPASSSPPCTTRPASGGDVGGDFYDAFETGESGLFARHRRRVRQGRSRRGADRLARHTVRAAAVRERSPAGDPADAEPGPPAADDRAPLLHGRGTRGWRHADGGARLTVCCGGHPPPLLLRATATVEAGRDARVRSSASTGAALSGSPLDLRPATRSCSTPTA